MKKILVTPRSLTIGNHPSLAGLKEKGYELVFCSPGVQPSEEDLLELLPGCVGYLAGVERISARVIDAATHLRVISRNGTGVDSIDLAACARRGVAVVRAEGANARGVAELTIGLLLDLARHLSRSSSAIASGKWMRYQGFEVEGKTLSVIGCGKVGKQVATLAMSMGMQVLGFDTYPDPAFAPGTAFRYASLAELLREADAITLHCPPAEEGRPLIGAAEIGSMRAGTLLINTARAELVDHEAVFEALQSGKLAGFATDVYEEEPPETSALASCEGVVMTPHIGGYTEESVARATNAAVENLLSVLENAVH